MLQTGNNFFNNNVKPDYDKITQLKNGYLMVYNFSVQDKEGVEGEIRFTIDSFGNVQKEKEIVGIPDCNSEKGNCGFNISKSEAKNIAEQAKFDKGIKDCDINFIWDTNKKNYIWEIITTLSESKGGDFKRASGKTMLIDPKDGNVINVKEWRIN